MTRYIQILTHKYRYIQMHTDAYAHTDTHTILKNTSDTDRPESVFAAQIHTDTYRYIQDTYNQYLVCICMYPHVSVCIMSVFAPENLLSDTGKYIQIHTR